MFDDSEEMIQSRGGDEGKRSSDRLFALEYFFVSGMMADGIESTVRSVTEIGLRLGQSGFGRFHWRSEGILRRVSSRKTRRFGKNHVRQCSKNENSTTSTVYYFSPQRARRVRKRENKSNANYSNFLKYLCVFV